MRFNMVIVPVVLCGCSSLSDNNMVDGSVHDGPAHNGDGPAVPTDGGTTTDVQCQTHTTTAVNADGSKSVEAIKFALVDGIDPTSHFSVEECDDTVTSIDASGSASTSVSGIQDPACPAGATCTDSDTPLPTYSHVCYWSDVGTFLDGKLYIQCGLTFTSYNASGVMTSLSSSMFGAIRIHH